MELTLDQLLCVCSDFSVVWLLLYSWFLCQTLFGMDYFLYLGSYSGFLLWTLIGIVHSIFPLCSCYHFARTPVFQWGNSSPFLTLALDKGLEFFGIFFVVSADVFHILCICLSYFILNFLLESFISINISFLLGFSSFLMNFLLPVDLSPDGCIDPRMCVSPLCHFRRYSFINGVLDCVLQSVYMQIVVNIRLYEYWHEQVKLENKTM